MPMLLPSRRPLCFARSGRSPLLAVVGLAVSAVLACATCGNPDPAQPTTAGDNKGLSVAPVAPPRLVIDIFAFARMLGTIAPCGCTTESLGGLQYAFGYIETHSVASSRLVLEPGSFLFPDPAGPEAPHDAAAWGQAEQRASTLQTRFAGLGGQLVSGFGPTDISSPSADQALSTWPMPRVLANSRKLDVHGVLAHRVVRLGDATRWIEAGVTAVVEPGLTASLGAEPPAEALRRELAVMRAAGVDLTVVLLQGSRSTAEQLAAEVEGIDLIVVGMPVGLDRTRLGASPARLGATWVIEPGEQAQTISHLRLEIDAGAIAALPGPAMWTLVPTMAAQQQELARLDARLAKFRADPAADRSFIARIEKERASLAESLERPAQMTGVVAVTVEQSKISCHAAATDADAAAALRRYDSWVATENQRRFAGVQAPMPAKGEASYVGNEQCDACHTEESELWAKTRHAAAYGTLVNANKQFDLSCVGCHVTAFREPGGSEVVENAKLQNIQCEQCHGPGSLHVAVPEKRGKANAIRRETAVDVCKECHTPEHSDTFDHAAYLRDVLGPGHGAERRAALGEGPTGRELRAAGLAAAGGGCKKMQ